MRASFQKDRYHQMKRGIKLNSACGLHDKFPFQNKSIRGFQLSMPILLLFCCCFVFDWNCVFEHVRLYGCDRHKNCVENRTKSAVVMGCRIRLNSIGTKLIFDCHRISISGASVAHSSHIK